VSEQALAHGEVGASEFGPRPGGGGFGGRPRRVGCGARGLGGFLLRDVDGPGGFVRSPIAFRAGRFLHGAIAVGVGRGGELVDDGTRLAGELLAQPVAERIERLLQLFVKRHGVVDGPLGSAPTLGS
jgi:hypothetical protein